MNHSENLNRMLLFAKVVECHSFSEAGRQLGIGKSAVSMQINRLEAELGTKLLNRTTRHLSLTEAGDRFYQSCARIVEEVAYAHEQIKGLRQEVSGLLRITCPVGFGNRVLVPALTVFLAEFPNVDVDIDFNDSNVNLVESGCDIAIRVGQLADSNLIARHLADTPMVLCASPDYLLRHGEPASLNQLSEHQWVLFSHTPTQLKHSHQGEQFVINTRGRVKVNNETARLNLALQGMGLTLMPAYEARQSISEGSLQRLFAEMALPSVPVTALYLDRKFLPKKISAMIQFLQQYLKSNMGSEWNGT